MYRPITPLEFRCSDQEYTEIARVVEIPVLLTQLAGLQILLDCSTRAERHFLMHHRLQVMGVRLLIRLGFLRRSGGSSLNELDSSTLHTVISDYQ